MGATAPPAVPRVQPRCPPPAPGPSGPGVAAPPPAGRRAANRPAVSCSRGTGSSVAESRWPVATASGRPAQWTACGASGWRRVAQPHVGMAAACVSGSDCGPRNTAARSAWADPMTLRETVALDAARRTANGAHGAGRPAASLVVRAPGGVSGQEPEKHAAEASNVSPLTPKLLGRALCQRARRANGRLGAAGLTTLLLWTWPGQAAIVVRCESGRLDRQVDRNV